MSAPERLTTTVSSKGQVVLPKAIRRALRWEAGMRLVIENTPEGVLLKALPAFAETRPEDVFGRLACRRRAQVPGGHGGGRSGRSKAAPCGHLIPILSFDT